jgi:hypothetical protein
VPLSCLLTSPELNRCLSSRFFLGHAAPQIFPDGHLEVHRHLRIKVVVKFSFAEKSANALQQLAKLVPHFSPPSSFMANTRPITPLSRCQYAASSASCFRPRWVMD